MALVRNFTTKSQDPNTIGISWDLPVGFNDTDSEIIVTRTSNHYPVELYNNVFPTKATDGRPVEIFRGSTITGLSLGSISVVTNSLIDISASFPTNPPLTGRLLRDCVGQVFRITSNTSTVLHLSGTPTLGKYVILPDFPTTITEQYTFEISNQTEAGPGYIKNLTSIVNNELIIRTFTIDSEVNCFFKDSLGEYFVVKTNTEDTLYFYGTDTPKIGVGMILYSNFSNNDTKLYVDTFKNKEEADVRIGTGLLDNVFYYYTAFTIPKNVNVAQAEFGQIDSGVSTQSSTISMKDRGIPDILYNKFWPTVHRQLDTTGDLEDLMKIFGFNYSYMHSLVDTYKLQDFDSLYINAVLPMSLQAGLPTVGFTIGADTIRRIAGNILTCWKLKGSKEGIALFIRMLTTWDITNGTADYNSAIQDYLPNVSALRFFDDALGSANVRLTETEPTVIPGGRFAKSLPGIVIPGFFTFREFVVIIPNVALFLGNTTSITIVDGNTNISDSNANFGNDHSLIGNFILPNQAEINDIYQILDNTSTTIIAKGIINNKIVGGNYAILSPLNTNRFIILNKLITYAIPHGTKAGFTFV